MALGSLLNFLLNLGERNFSDSKTIIETPHKTLDNVINTKLKHSKVNTLNTSLKIFFNVIYYYLFKESAAIFIYNEQKSILISQTINSI